VTTRDKYDSTGNVTPKPTDQNTDNLAVSNPDNSENEVEEVVFIVQTDGTVRKQKVASSIQDINYIEITEGLKEGEQVVTGPYDVVSKTLKEKAKVKVVPKNELFDKK
jgi:HlyD family secretion protein